MATVIVMAMATAMAMVIATTMGDSKMDNYSVGNYPRIRSNQIRSSCTDQSIYEWTGPYMQSVDREFRPVDLQMDQTHLSTRTFLKIMRKSVSSYFIAHIYHCKRMNHRRSLHQSKQKTPRFAHLTTS